MENQKELTLPVEELSPSQARKLLPIDFSDLHLSLKEYRFMVAYWNNGFHGPEAAKEAGYHGNRDTLRGVAWSIQKRPHVNEAMRRMVQLSMNPYKDRLEFEILDKQYKRATWPPDVFFSDGGKAKMLGDIPREWHEVIDGIEWKYFGKDAQVATLVYQLPNRDAALKELWRMIHGGVGDDDKIGVGKLPSEARDRAGKILQRAREEFEAANGSVTKLTTKVTFSAKQVQEAVKRGRGRPKTKNIVTVINNGGKE